MANVILEYEKHNISVDLNLAGFKELLAYMNVNCKEVQASLIKKNDIKWCDVYIAIRPNIPNSVIVAQKLKKLNKLYVTYFDDDLCNRPNSFKRRNMAAEQCLAAADVVMGPNPVLMSEYKNKSKCERIICLNTVVHPYDFSKFKKRGDVIQIVYAAGKDHNKFFETYINPILPQLFEKYKGKLHFTFVGVHPNVRYLHLDNMFSFEPIMSIKAYELYMKQNHFDIGLAPLFNNDFCNKKYFNKFIEYSKAGIPGIYSNCLPATLIVKNGENGILVDNDPSKWFMALSYAIDNELEMQKYVQNAQKLLRDNFTLDYNINILKQQIPELEKKHVDGCNFDWKSHNFSHYMFKIQDYVFKIYKRMRSYLEDKVKILPF